MKKLVLLLVLMMGSTAYATYTPYDPNNPEHNNVIGVIQAMVGAVINRDITAYDPHGVYDGNYIVIDMIDKPANSVMGPSCPIEQPHIHPGKCNEIGCLWYDAQWAWIPTEDDVGHHEFFITCHDSFMNTDYSILIIEVFMYNHAPIIEVMD